jgi:glucose/arabinose dehydrogenase
LERARVLSFKASDAVGIAVAKDGALLVSEDANGTIWRIASTKSAQN